MGDRWGAQEVEAVWGRTAGSEDILMDMGVKGMASRMNHACSHQPGLFSPATQPQERKRVWKQQEELIGLCRVFREIFWITLGDVLWRQQAERPGCSQPEPWGSFSSRGAGPPAGRRVLRPFCKLKHWLGLPSVLRERLFEADSLGRMSACS